MVLLGIEFFLTAQCQVFLQHGVVIRLRHLLRRPLFFCVPAEDLINRALSFDMSYVTSHVA